jgi:Zn finger protein HypA/HybF involved in hydrogenase expression
LVKTELKLISLKIFCDCGKSFIAEDLEPECPFCDKNYSLQIHGNKKGIKLKIAEGLE